MKPRPRFGDIFYSDYFECRCVLVRYESDDVWWFYPEGYGIPRIMKARSKASSMKWETRV